MEAWATVVPDFATSKGDGRRGTANGASYSFLRTMSDIDVGVFITVNKIR
nr:unnamed protein product [Callosobruchus chinensis]